MKTFTKYMGGYSKETQVIVWFWEILSTFTASQLSDFLFFISGSHRVPHAGFKEIHFEITKVFD